jgi:signal transduction histidine kinase
MAHLRPFAWVIAGEKRTEAWRAFFRAVFHTSHAEIVKRYEATIRRWPIPLFVAMAFGAILYTVSTLSSSIITIWLLWLVATEIGCHLFRKMAVKRPPSRLDNLQLVAVNFINSGAWCVMAVILEFRSPPEMLAGVLVLTGILLSTSVVAVQAHIWLLNLLIVGSALLAPEVANLLSRKPHAVAIGLLTIKALFLLNYTSLIRSWYQSARRQGMMRVELEQRRKQADDLAAARSMFLAHMSHEIRSPLAGVTLLASVLKRLESVPEDQRQMIEQIDAGGQAILNLLNTVLDYSKIEAGKITLLPKPTDVRTLLDSIAGFFQLQAAETQTRFSAAIAPALPDALLLDETRLRQVVTNLVSNAVTNSPGAAVELKAGYEGGVLLVEVADTGRGVDDEMQKYLFTPHEQPAGTDSNASLGLAVSRGLVNLMGGEIGFRDTPGGGATFWFNVPARAVEEAAPS